MKPITIKLPKLTSEGILEKRMEVTRRIANYPVTNVEKALAQAQIDLIKEANKNLNILWEEE